MTTDSNRYETGNADALRWQTGYRVVLAAIAGAVSILFRTPGVLSLSPVAEAALTPGAAQWILGLISVLYASLVVVIRVRLRTTHRAGRTLATLMVIADLAVVFWLVFLLARP